VGVGVGVVGGGSLASAFSCFALSLQNLVATWLFIIIPDFNNLLMSWTAAQLLKAS
jgi:hypothetical protein